MDEVYRERGENLPFRSYDMCLCYWFSPSTIAFVQDQHINHSLLIVDLSGGDKIAPKI